MLMLQTQFVSPLCCWSAGDLYSNIFLFMRKLKEYFLLVYGFKQNEDSASTYREGIWEEKCYYVMAMRTSSKENGRLQ